MPNTSIINHVASGYIAFEKVSRPITNNDRIRVITKSLMDTHITK